MSGHSKWHNIQVRKGKQDARKANSFTKVGRMITVAAREGGGDPAANFSLRLAIEKAKEVNFPKENVERAIKKGTGELVDDTTLDEVLYEGFGPGSVGVLVDAITDNKNRTVGDIKHLFSLYGGSLAGPGSVKWQFNRMGVVRINRENLESRIQNLEDFELQLIEAGADDMIKSEFGLEICSSVENFQKVLEVVKSAGAEPADAGIEWVAKETIGVSPDLSEQVQKLSDALDANDDVRAVYTNEA